MGRRFGWADEGCCFDDEDADEGPTLEEGVVFVFLFWDGGGESRQMISWEEEGVNGGMARRLLYSCSPLVCQL